MCKGNCNCGKCGGCTVSLIAKILVIVGGVNWGLVGAGWVFGGSADWNLVHMVLGSMPMVEGIVYLLVGIAAIAMIIGCKCKTCTGGVCATDHASGPAAGNM